MFQHVSVGLPRLIDRLFTNLLNINIIETRTEGIKSSDPGGGGHLVERWVRGCAAQMGCFFGLSGLPMAPFLFENWFR